MLEERDHRRGDAHDLLRADVHVVDHVDRLLEELVLVADEHAVFGEVVPVVQGGVGLRDVELLLLGRIEVDDLVGDDRADPDLGDLAVLDLARKSSRRSSRPPWRRLCRRRSGRGPRRQDLAERVAPLVARRADEAAHLAVRRLDEAVAVDLAVRRQRPDEADARPSGVSIGHIRP